MAELSLHIELNGIDEIGQQAQELTRLLKEVNAVIEKINNTKLALEVTDKPQ